MTQLRSELERLHKELREMREELEETTRGTLALYNEIDNKNAELRRHQQQLEQKNRELSRALADLKTSESARIRAARTAAIGNIVVTYNHEINNPLAIVFGALDMIRLQKKATRKEIEEQLDRISRAADRIHGVILKIKQYENLLPKSYINWNMLDLDSESPPL
ncbi:MAG: histidine kinase dimerization/phospho-acceptor domain-containing protein [bacterium]